MEITTALAALFRFLIDVTRKATYRVAGGAIGLSITDYLLNGKLGVLGSLTLMASMVVVWSKFGAFLDMGVRRLELSEDARLQRKFQIRTQHKAALMEATSVIDQGRSRLSEQLNELEESKALLSRQAQERLDRLTALEREQREELEAERSRLEKLRSEVDLSRARLAAEWATFQEAGRANSGAAHENRNVEAAGAGPEGAVQSNSRKATRSDDA